MLSQSQKRHLRSLLHSLKPVVMLGQKGLSENVLSEIEKALSFHELIKIKIVAERDERAQMIAAIVEHTDAQLVQQIGHMAGLFRRNPKKPKIVLPSQ